MKIFKLLLLMMLFLPIFVLGHPGNTSSDGCHYCRTNCDKWGENWNERHCHVEKDSTVSLAENNNEDKNSSLPTYGLISLGGLGLGYLLFKKK